MQIIRDLQSTHQISNTAIRALVQQRINDLGGEAFDSPALGYFLIIQPGDTLEAIDTQLGFSILANRFDGSRFDQPGFTPSFEFVEEFQSCYDMVFVISDDGYGIEVFIPKDVGIPELLTMCKQHAFIADVESKQATIYVTPQAMTTVAALAGLDEGDRDYLNAKPATRLSQREGYFLSADSMRLAVLPVDAEVVLVLSPKDMDAYCRHVTFPPELRGVVFSGAPRLPENYAAILGYWSPLKVTEHHDGAEYCQNLLNECEASTGVLLSNGVVVCIHGVRGLTAGLAPHQCIEIHVPVDSDMLGMDREKFDSPDPYDVSPDLPFERIFLKVQDVLDSPDPDAIAIAVIHSENHDADFFI